MKNDDRENESTDPAESGEPQGRAVGGILAVIAAMLALVITLQMCN